MPMLVCGSTSMGDFLELVRVKYMGRKALFSLTSPLLLGCEICN